MPDAAPPSPWKLLLASRKVQFTIAGLALVLFLVLGAEVAFVVLTIQGKLSVEAFVTATFVTLPTGVVGVAWQIKSVVDGIAQEDAAAKASPTSVSASGAARVVVERPANEAAP